MAAGGDKQSQICKTLSVACGDSSPKGRAKNLPLRESIEERTKRNESLCQRKNNRKAESRTIRM